MNDEQGRSGRSYWVGERRIEMWGANTDRINPKEVLAYHLWYLDKKLKPEDYHLRLLPRTDKDWPIPIPMDKDFFFQEGDRFAVVKNVPIRERIRLDAEESAHVPVVNIAVKPYKMDREACAQCPFRESSNLGYDQDSQDCLDNNMEPSCHMKVGVTAIFHDEPPIHRCVGHDLWIEGIAGFHRPHLVEERP